VWRYSDGAADLAAARALEAGDPFGAVGRVALRDDAPALALRRIAMVQHFPERDPMSARSGVGHEATVAVATADSCSPIRKRSSKIAQAYFRRPAWPHRMPSVASSILPPIVTGRAMR
jgi:hypothetical protein